MALRDFATTVTVPIGSTLIGALVGAAVVGLVSYYTSKSILTEQAQIEQAVEAYADFISRATEFDTLQQRRLDFSEEMLRVIQQLGAARSRAMVFGTPEVIAAYRNFRSAGATTATCAGRQAFMEVILSMRAHVSDYAPNDDLVRNLEYALFTRPIDCRESLMAPPAVSSPSTPSPD